MHLDQGSPNMAINNDPYHIDPEIESANLPPEGGIEALDQFNGPVPGHSLTGEPGSQPWEKPPVYTDDEEALKYVLKEIRKPETEEEFLKLMLAGIPIEAITNTITFSGFQGGFWTPDLAELLKFPVAMELIGLAAEKKIPATMFSENPMDKRERESLSDADVLSSMRENRPDMSEALEYAMDVLNEEQENEPIEEGDMPQESFMDMEESV